MGDAVHVGDQKICRKPLYLLLNFSVNVKLLLKKIVLKLWDKNICGEETNMA